MTSEGVRKQIRGGEDLHTEFVKSPERVDHIARAVCGFLNASGGTIFCGIDEKGSAVGIANPDAARERLEAKLQKLISPKALFTLDVEQDDGGPIIAIEVPEGRDRPYVVEGAVYIREGSVTRAANAAALRSMVQVQATAADRWERRPSPALDYDDLDRTEIRATVMQASETSRLQFTDPDDDLSVLRELSMITGTGFTQGADVVFARAPARRHPQCRIRFIRFETDKGGDVYADNRWFEGPLVRVFESVFEAVRANVRTQSLFPEGEIRRRDRPDYPLEALREGLVNAIAHRDYSSFSGG
ncbi:MAG: putative DNA binding domain-containing protein, partial [Betaproteobacteria bacterium]|nr:putative DNA binding domain-containing protein [Betaproteobacteria bacterium]